MTFERVQHFVFGYGPSPYESYFPNIQLSVCEDIAAGARQVATHSPWNSVFGLPYINWNFVQITQGVNPNLTGHIFYLLGAILYRTQNQAVMTDGVFWIWLVEI